MQDVYDYFDNGNRMKHLKHMFVGSVVLAGIVLGISAVVWVVATFPLTVLVMLICTLIYLVGKLVCDELF